MNKIIFIVLFVLYSSLIFGQDNKCNQSFIGENKENIPDDICLPINYHIRQILDNEDINLDGLNDYIFSYSKINAEDGDTIYLAVYIMNQDSSFILFKKFDNLYPIIFKDYSLAYNIKDSTLNELQGMYSGFYPLKSLKILKGEIQIILNQGYKEYQTLHFTYKNNFNNWFLTSSEIWFENSNEHESIKIEYKVDEQLPIDSFNFFDWL